MRKSTIILFTLFFAACTTVPVTGRKQLSLVSSDQMLAMSFSSYKEFLKENKISSDRTKTEMVRRVGNNIKNAVTTFMAQNNAANQLSGFEWEFNLVEDEAKNAWAMPGGKVVFYTGILPICRDEKGIAVVMGHEVAHAIAEHGSERMSQALLTELGGVALSTALKNNSAGTQNVFMSLYGVGSQVGVLLPFGRKQESEADRLGLIFMAMAGYDPSEAIDFWNRMESGNTGGRPPEFLSTHPAPGTRIANLKSWMPEAMKYYKKSR